MTVVVEKTPTTLPQATPNGAAPWHVRAGAFAIDVLPGLAVAATMALTALTVPPGSAVAVVMRLSARIDHSPSGR